LVSAALRQPSRFIPEGCFFVAYPLPIQGTLVDTIAGQHGAAVPLRRISVAMDKVRWVPLSRLSGYSPPRFFVFLHSLFSIVVTRPLPVKQNRRAADGTPVWVVKNIGQHGSAIGPVSHRIIDPLLDNLIR